MVEVIKYLPDDMELSFLRQIHHPIVISRPEKRIGGLSTIVLEQPGAQSFCLRVTAHTVAFKFEVFRLRVEPWTGQVDRKLIEMSRIVEFDSLKCLLRFEWVRPALQGEIPAHFEQIVGERGRRQDIRSSATKVAASMVGLAFYKAKSNLPTTVILNSDDDPVTLRVLDKTNDIEQAISDCEALRTAEIEQWAGSIGQIELNGSTRGGPR
jgi:hypothetical protein